MTHPVEDISVWLTIYPLKLIQFNGQILLLIAIGYSQDIVSLYSILIAVNYLTFVFKK